MPRRRCVGCGRIAPKAELIRFAIARENGARRRAIIDASATMPGRGAYLCASQAVPVAGCLELARKRGGFARALRCAVTVDAELVESTPEGGAVGRRPTSRAPLFQVNI